jgi:hypothetical protein
MKQQGLNRRAFFRNAARYAAAAGLAAVTGFLVLRRPTRLPGQRCVADGICRSCAQAAACTLPQALSFRAATAPPANTPAKQVER